MLSDVEIGRILNFEPALSRHHALLASLAWQHDAAEGSAEPEVTPALSLFANVAWSAITEPGDRFAGSLRQHLGAAQALALLVRGDDVSEWLGHFYALGISESLAQEFGDLALATAESISRWRPRLSQSRVLNLLDVAANFGIQLVSDESSLWPSSLNDLHLATPALLWVRGEPLGLSKLGRSWALVGSRVATNYGIEATSSLVQGLGDAGFSIVSGGAFGIDAAAHRSALALGAPTVAVMAGGVDKVYPRSNEQLFDKILENDVILSEVAPGTSPTKWRFLQRNRIIAALSQGTCVVEAGYRSGAINTANHASGLDRPVAAVPGSIFASGSAGTHRLIAEGKAQLVTSANDLIEMVDGFESANYLPIAVEPSDKTELLPLDTRVYDAIGLGSASAEQICERGGLTSHEARIGLTSLVKLGLVSPRGSMWARA